MPKRLTDNNKWQDEWFMNLPCKYKLFWVYLLDNCDHAGVWKVNFKLASFYIGDNLDMNEVKELFSTRIFEFKEGYWFLPKFIKFQYGKINNDQVGRSVKKILETNNLSGAVEGLDSPLAGAIAKAKDKDKDIRKGGLGENPWNTTPFPSDVGLLPEAKIKAAIDRIKYTMEVDISAEKVTGLWEVFKKENLTGKKYYPNEEEVQQHFSNWLKFQKLEKNGKSKIRARDEGVFEFLDIAQKDYEYYENVKARLDTTLPDGLPPDTGSE